MPIRVGPGQHPCPEILTRSTGNPAYRMGGAGGFADGYSKPSEASPYLCLVLARPGHITADDYGDMIALSIVSLSDSSPHTPHL